MRICFFCFCCLINIFIKAQVPKEQVAYLLENGKTQNYSMGHSVSSFLRDNVANITEYDLNIILELLKEHYYIKNEDLGDIQYAMKTIYNITENPIIRGEAIYFIEQIINDSTVFYSMRGAEYLNGLDLDIFNKKMKDEIIKNLNYPYKNDVNFMLKTNMILLAGALNMTELKDRLQVIADSSISSNNKNAALMALCRMGDKKALKTYFAKLSSMRLQDITHYHWGEIQYIKQKESIDLILKVLYSEETEPFVDERLPDQKIAYSAVYALQRISTNFPYKKRIVYGKKEDPLLEQAREWAKNNEIIINRDIW